MFVFFSGVRLIVFDLLEPVILAAILQHDDAAEAPEICDRRRQVDAETLAGFL